MAWKYNNKTIRTGAAWKDNNGKSYMPSWWNKTTDAEKTAAGLTWTDPPAAFDNRFFWDADTPKALDDVNAVNGEGNAILDIDGNQLVTKGLKSVWKEKTKTLAAGLLAPTDWKIVKAAEVSSYSVDQATLDYRASVRTASNTIEAAIDAVADHDAFLALWDIPVDADGVPTGNAPINDWPDGV